MHEVEIIMKRIIPLKLLLICLIVPFVVIANDKDSNKKGTITWQVMHWPPLMILDGPEKGKGRYDNMLIDVQRVMSDYEHETLRMNLVRYWQLLREGKNMCNLLNLKNPQREKFAYYSIPVSIVIPNHIIMRRWKMRLLGNPKSYSLVKLLKDKRFRGLLEKGRSYSETIDKILIKHEKNSNMRRATLKTHNFIPMLLNDRIDYIIEYPYVTSWMEPIFSNKSGLLGSIAIEELDPYYYSYMVCTKNDWGKQVVQDFNNAMRTLMKTKKYREVMERWYFKDNEIRFIREKYNELLEAAGVPLK